MRREAEKFIQSVQLAWIDGHSKSGAAMRQVGKVSAEKAAASVDLQRP